MQLERLLKALCYEHTYCCGCTMQFKTFNVSYLVVFTFSLSSYEHCMFILQIKCYMKQLLSAVEYFHLHGVMHRDIKGSNLLVNNEGTLKVADFGLANFITSERKKALTNHVVTLWYRPPELLLGSTNYGSSVDLWSVGCIFGELLLRKVIFQGKSEVVANK